jgi:hypothetical protein
MLKNTDLRHISTGVRLTQAERLAAEMRHLAAMNDAQLAEKKARNARRGLKPMAIGTLHVPAYIAKHFLHCKVA